MARTQRNRDTSSTIESENTVIPNSSTESSYEQTYCVIDDSGSIKYLPITEAKLIIEQQQRQISNFTSKLKEIESNSELIKQYFGKSTDVNQQLLLRYRKLLDWILKGGIGLLFFSLILIAIPLFLFIYKYDTNYSLQDLKSILWWIVGIYGLINVGGLFTWGLATFGFNKQLTNLEKRTDRIEDKLYK